MYEELDPVGDLARRPEFDVLREINGIEIAELTRSLVKIPSVNPPGEEKEVAEFIASWFDKRKFDPVLTEAACNRPNVEVRLQGEDEGSTNDKTLVFNGHMDVVPAGSGWSHDPFGGEITNGRVYGRGSGDMKGGLAAIMIALEILKRKVLKKLSGSILFQAVVDEEKGGRFGTYDLVRRGLKGDFGIVAEPTSLNLCVAHKGIVTFEVTTHGKAAHASVPEAGVNAILEMHKVVEALTRYSGHLSRSVRHPLLGSPTLNIGVIEGGTKSNVVPDSCWISAERRTVPPERTDEVIGQLKSLLESVAKEDTQLVYDLRIDHETGASELADGEEGLQCVLSSLRRFREDVQPTGFTATCDAYFLNVLARIPTVILGPGDLANIHTADEHVQIDQLQVAAQVYALTALRFLGRES